MTSLFAPASSPLSTTQIVPSMRSLITRFVPSRPPSGGFVRGRRHLLCAHVFPPPNTFGSVLHNDPPPPPLNRMSAAARASHSATVLLRRGRPRGRPSIFFSSSSASSAATMTTTTGGTLSGASWKPDLASSSSAGSFSAGVVVKANVRGGSLSCRCRLLDSYSMIQERYASNNGTSWVMPRRSFSPGSTPHLWKDRIRPLPPLAALRSISYVPPASLAGWQLPSSSSSSSPPPPSPSRRMYHASSSDDSGSEMLPPLRTSRGAATARGGSRDASSSGDDSSTSPARDNNQDNIVHGSRNNVLLNVSAVHVAQTIDLYPCLSDLMAKYTFRKQSSHKNSVLIELSPEQEDTAQLQQGQQKSSSSLLPRYVAMYRFGSLVFVNCPPHMVAEFSHLVKRRHAVQPVPNGLERRENYGILLQQQHQQQQPSDLEAMSETVTESAAAVEPLASEAAMSSRPRTQRSGSTTSPLLPLPPTSAATTGDYCVLNELDMNAISVVSSVMAQTVALDTYNDMVDDLLAKFATINHKVTQTGWVPDSERAFLFKTIAQNHIIFNDMISKLRIKDRSDTAWNLTRYESTWYGMRDEFEMDERFENMEFKLKLIEQNAKFFVEALQSQKSNSLEWIIVVLIAVECVIMTADMTGMGEALLSPLFEQFKGWWGWDAAVAAAPPDGVGGGSGAEVLANSSSSSSTSLAAADSTASTTAQPGRRAS